MILTSAFASSHRPFITSEISKLVDLTLNKMSKFFNPKSASITNILYLFYKNKEISADKVDLPTPPFPLVTAMTSFILIDLLLCMLDLT